MIATAERRGSLDGAIRAHRPNALADLAASLPALRAIGFNGGKALAIGRKALGEGPSPALIALPSSSPAFTRPFDEKLRDWLQLRAFLDGGGDQARP